MYLYFGWLQTSFTRVVIIHDPKAGHLFELVDFKLACSLVQGYVLSLFLSFFSTLRSLNITEVKAEGINV